MFGLMNTVVRPRRLPTMATDVPARPSGSPHLSVSPRRVLPGWTVQQRAGYYFDAAWQTTQTLRRLLRTKLAAEDLGLRPPPELLGQAVESLLQSISPGLHDDSESRACFDRLLQSHLSGLTAEELERLASELRAQRFDGTVMESVVDDPMLEEFGFANGPPRHRQRTLMFTPDLYLAIDEARDTASARAAHCDPARRLTPEQARQVREFLADCAARQAEVGVTLPQFCGVAAQLALAVGLDAVPATVTATAGLHPVSTVAWQHDALLVDLSAWSALSLREDSMVYAVLLRDLLELTLARKLAGPDILLQSLDLTIQTQQKLLVRLGVYLRVNADRVVPGHVEQGDGELLPTLEVYLEEGGYLVSSVPRGRVLRHQSCLKATYGLLFNGSHAVNVDEHSDPPIFQVSLRPT